MKLLTIILSLYIFALSAIPCEDIEIDSAAHSTITKSEEKNHSHDKDNDLCSPFCVCNCCGQQTLTSTQVITFDFPIQFEEIKTLDSIYTSALHSNFYGSIWQPPQLV